MLFGQCRAPRANQIDAAIRPRTVAGVAFLPQKAIRLIKQAQSPKAEQQGRKVNQQGMPLPRGLPLRFRLRCLGLRVFLCRLRPFLGFQQAKPMNFADNLDGVDCPPLLQRDPGFGGQGRFFARFRHDGSGGGCVSPEV